MLRKRIVSSDKESHEKIEVIKIGKSANLKKKFFIFLGCTLIFMYFVIPLSVYLCPTVRRHAVFLHYVSLSGSTNLSLPSESGLSCTRHFYINSENDVHLGVWHIPPASSLFKCKNDVIPVIDEFNDARPVFLYLHGNAGTRAGNHRVELYKLLSSKLDAHIIAFDYRGYGDSSNISPTESGLVSDTEHVFKWLLQRIPPSRIYIWGHSLGTGVGVAFLEKLSKENYKPAALILEAPFTKIIDAAKYHPLSIFHRYMPFFETLIAKPIGDKDTGFDSLSRINKVDCPLLILHAKDDGFVPFHQGKMLYDKAISTRKHLSLHLTKFVEFDEKFDLGHKNIYKSPELPNIVKEFIESINITTV